MIVDHIGVGVENIEVSKEYYTTVLGYTVVSELTIDKSQGVRILFLESDNGVRIELLEPLDASSPVYNSVKKKMRLLHICYKVNNITEKIKELETKGCKVFVQPIFAPAFKENIAFLYTPEQEVIELVEYKCS